MRSVVYDRFGGVEVLELRESAIPEPGPGEVVVEVLASGINHVESFVREGRFEGEVPTAFPATQGTDFAGVVVAVGDGVEGIRRRAEVVGFAPRTAQATHVVVAADRVVPKPPALGWEAAGGLFLAGVTAHRTIEELGLGPDDTVVVSAAAGGVGHLEIQLARAAGARVIGTAGERNADYLRQLGVTPVLYGEGMAERIRKEAPDGVTAYVDNFGQDGERVAEELDVPRSRYRSSTDRRDLELAALTAGDEEVPELRRRLARMAELAAARTVTVLTSGFYPYVFVADAYDDLEKLHARGKIVLGMRPVNGFRVLKARDHSDSLP